MVLDTLPIIPIFCRSRRKAKRCSATSRSVEINKNIDPFFPLLKSHNLILQENPNWKDSFYVDVRDPLWAKTVLEDIVPSVLRQGFDGLFLDTLDNPIDLEDKNHEKFSGMTETAAHLW